MRTVPGRSDHVVVVGAGLSGLAAALHLCGRGRTVTVIEAASVPGGRAGRRDAGGYRMDTGPTVLTMPGIVQETLAAVGADDLPLVRLDPAYRAHFHDGTSLDVRTGRAEMAEAVRAFAGADEADGYLRLRDWLTRLHEVEYGRFIAANVDSPLGLLTPSLARLAALGGFGRWERAVGRFIRDERLRRVFTFQSLYAGLAPHRALALYAVIAYMDTVGGVYFPSGGMRALPDALASAAAAAGVVFRYGTSAALERRGRRVIAVRTGDGDRIRCDAVVLTCELTTAYRLLGHIPRRRLVAAPSAVVVHLGVPYGPEETLHHNLLFGRAWRTTFGELTREGRPMRDPSLLLTRPTATDPSLAPYGRHLLSVLAPVPNLARGPLDWDRIGPAYADELVDRLSCWPGTAGVPASAEILHVTTPADWRRQGLLAGTPFGPAHTFAQTGPFRPANLPRSTDNVVLAGCGTVPGVGVPTVLISGRLAADRITGAPAGRTRRVLDRAGRR